MDKAMYSNDIKWYDDAVHDRITALSDKYDNAIPIFGGALGAYNYINTDNPDFESFVKYLPSVISHAKFFKWHEGVVGALRRFCRLCFVDPALIECYIGARLEDYAEYHTKNS